jgi:hypothetical protein
LQLGIQRVLTVAAGGTQIVGSPNVDRAKQRGDQGLAFTLIAGQVAAGTGNTGWRLGRGCQCRQAGDQARTKLLEQAKDMLFNLG